MEHELRIAVVDDMEQDRIQIMEETDAILSRAKIAHSIDCYADAEALLDAIQGGRKYHLLLLDVLMDVNPDYPPLDPAEAAKVPTILAELENGE